MTIDETTPLPEVARAVCTALQHAGVTAVLTGGSAATYYAPAAYQSSDIDFVVVALQKDGAARADEHLAALGFRRERDHYRHDRSPYPIEFPPGPLAVGGAILTSWRTDEMGDTVLHVLTPTDSCKDRLAAFLHWNDRSSLEQALAVAQATRHQLDFADLAAWAESEGGAKKYAEFARWLEAAD